MKQDDVGMTNVNGADTDINHDDFTPIIDHDDFTPITFCYTDIPLAITNITTNGSADDIKQVYTVVDDCRGLINDKLKSIAYSLNTVLTQSGVRGESSIEPDGSSKTS